MGVQMGTVGPYNSTFVDFPSTEQEKKELKCQKSTVSAECGKLKSCLTDVFNSFKKCCIPYDATPEWGQVDGNCNSALAWAISICLEGSTPTTYLPTDWRVNPGLIQKVPKCVREQLKKPKNEPLKPGHSIE
ncbi:MAG: hypothetical protein JWP89_7013 [Schlesneria sp.]|nr:hypothetical protein [Schlesneria sp.]